jgi:hypothetical protein
MWEEAHINEDQLNNLHLIMVMNCLNPDYIKFFLEFLTEFVKFLLIRYFNEFIHEISEFV